MSQPQSAGVSSAEPVRSEPAGLHSVPSPPPVPSRRGLFMAGGVAALVSVPLGLGAGRWVGALASNTLLAVVPALLLVLLVPPLAVVGAAAWQGRRMGAGRLRVGASVGTALGVQLMVVGGAIAMGASAHRPGDTVLLTLVEALLLAAVASRHLPPSPSGRGPG